MKDLLTMLFYGNGQINVYGKYLNSIIINSNTFLYPNSGNSQNQILSIANQGVGFINYTAHGWESGWADPEFDLNDESNNVLNAISNNDKLLLNQCI